MLAIRCTQHVCRTESSLPYNDNKVNQNKFKKEKKKEQIQGNMLLLTLLMQTDLHINYFILVVKEVIQEIAGCWQWTGMWDTGLKVRYPFISDSSIFKKCYSKGFLWK